MDMQEEERGYTIGKMERIRKSKGRGRIESQTNSFLWMIFGYKNHMDTHLLPKKNYGKR
jgi:hypothetical protein